VTAVRELIAISSRRPTGLVLAAATVLVSLVAAGCGGGSGSPGVASVASPPATATSTTQSGSGSGDKAFGPAPGSQGGQFSLAMKVGNAADGAKFSACMRKHGVTSFPDPDGQGVITIHSGMGIDPGSPTFRSARSACEKLLPNGGQPTPAQQAQRQQEMLAFSKCMRAHGIADFPDPTTGGLRIQVHPGSDLDPSNPQFQAAQKACQGNLPFKFPGGAAPGTGKPGSGGG
jgi:hypothetical protein